MIKNVAGYDLAKLMSGGCGTLGLLTELTVRLHPRRTSGAPPSGAATIRHAVASAAAALAHLPLEAEALDLRWEGETGAVLARFGGREAPAGARRAARAERRRADGRDGARRRRAVGGAARRPARHALCCASRRRAGAASARCSRRARAERLPVVARAAHALAWLRLPDDAPELLAATVRRLREALALLRAAERPPALRAAVDPWGPIAAPQLELMRRVKERFDPERRCNPGLFAGAL